jgi:hypothetical protein
LLSLSDQKHACGSLWNYYFLLSIFLYNW